MIDPSRKSSNPFLDFVSLHALLFRQGKSLKTGKAPSRPRPKSKPGAPTALNFSPHPDDECIVGALALRLQREAGFKVINVAVTLGSKVPRRRTRLKELTNACKSLGWGMELVKPGGLDRITPTARLQEPEHWETAVRATAALIWRHRPKVILLPHVHDWHLTHIGTHWLVMDALRALPASFRCKLVETEFWGQMTTPNLLVESSVRDVADLMAAWACHAGEMKRNPYHLRLPAWMMDNVRRGAELAGKTGGKAPDFTFGTLYRLGVWQSQARKEIAPQNPFVGSTANLKRLLK